MPSAYAGTTTPPQTTTAWAATTGYTSGTSYVIPTAFTGQYFQCTASGTSGGSEPNWSNPASLPVPGTVFAGDGGVTWVCMGSIIAGEFGNIVVDVPVDSDPSLVAVLARALKNLANNFAWIFKNAGILNLDNIWTGIQLFAGYNATTPALSGSLDPGIGRFLLEAWAAGKVSGTQTYARIYADNTNAASYLLTVNAFWSGSVWVYDNSGEPALWYQFGQSFLAQKYSGSTGWADNAWVPALSLGSPFTEVAGIPVLGGTGVSATAGNSQDVTNITTIVNLIGSGGLQPAYVPGANELIRIDISCNSPSATPPVVSLTWTDMGGTPISGITVGSMSLVGVVVNYYYSASYTIAVQAAGYVAVAIQHAASETLNDAWATITVLA